VNLSSAPNEVTLLPYIMCPPPTTTSSMSTTTRDSRPQLESLGPALSPEDLDKVSEVELNPLDEKFTHSGIVRKIMTEKQYGFIQTEDGSDLFFMLNDVQEPWVVAIGDQVTYHVQTDGSHAGKSRAIRIMPSLLARPSCHSPGGSVLRQTNALRSSMVRMTISAKPAAPQKTAEEWQTEIDAATAKFRQYLVNFAGMDEDEAVEFGEMKIAKAMRSEDVSSMPKHLQKIALAKRGLEECNNADQYENTLLDRAEHALRLSVCAEELKQQHARAVIDPARMAKSNRFTEGDEHAGEIAQIVRNKFGFIVAETTSASKRVLKQKVFFHLKNAPGGIAVGDRVTFTVQADPYSQEKMIAKDISITRKVVQQRGLVSQQPPPRSNPKRSGNGNQTNENHRASIDNNWRRGRDILHAASESVGDRYVGGRRTGQRRW